MDEPSMAQIPEEVMAQIPEEVMAQIPEEIKDQLTPELLEQAAHCETQEEAIALLQDNGMEISDDMLDKVAAGGYWCGGGGCNCDWYHF